jgi:uncharacterized repeat protein (TIGR01451 family)
MRGLRTVQSRNGRRSRPQVFGTRFEALERRELLATFTVTNSGDLTSTGAVVPGSLRDAIGRANLNPGEDTISFNIGGGGVHTIVVSPAPQPTPQPLPAINDSVTIDGTSQPGYAGTPLIYINGVNAGNAANGLQIGASNTTIMALGIENFAQAGVRIEAGGVTLSGNFIGIDPTGSIARPNSGPGIVVDGQSDCHIGGFSPGQANLISGNRGSGVQLIAGASNNTIENNFIGTDFSGSAAVPNSGAGVLISNSSFNTIGGPGVFNTTGTLVSQGNIISGNSGSGIQISGQGSSGNTVQGNTIGLNASGSSRVPNQGDGVDILGSGRNVVGGLTQSSGNIISGNQGAGLNLIGALGTAIQGNLIGTDSSGAGSAGNTGAGISLTNSTGSVIGGSQANSGNTIAFNGLSGSSAGVEILSGQNVPILGNSIFGNGRLGINLIVTGDPASGVTPNHAGGVVVGEPNDAQNYPVLISAVTGAGRTLIQGTFDAAANASYTIQFFSNATADASGFGQGQKLIGQSAFTTDASGHSNINLILPTPSTVGQFISATATNSQGDTSEFCNDVMINAANIADTGLQVVASPSPATLGGNITYTLTVSNNGPAPATGVTVTDFFPASTNFVSATVSQGSPPIQNPGSVVAKLGSIAPGGFATVTVVVSTTATGAVTNTATVSSNEIDPNTLDNNVVTTTQVNIPAEVSVVMSTDPALAVNVGDQLAYTIIVTNNGPGTATNVVVTDPLPAGVTIVTEASGQGNITVNGNTVIASLGSLPSGVSTAIRIVVVPNDVTTLINTATATLNEIDPDPTNNSATTSVPVLAAADVSVGITASPEPVLVGQNLTYVITVTNNGPSPATGVSVTDLLPADVNFVSAIASQGTTSSGSGSVVASLGSIAAFATATITVVVVPTASGSISNEVTVTRNEVDPNPANDSASIISTVSPADVALTIQANPSAVLAGGNLTYTLLVTNNGPATAENVSLVDQLPDGVTFVSAVSAQGSARPLGSQVFFDLGSIASGATVAATIVVIPVAPGLITNSASVSAFEFDPNTDNNAVSLDTLVSPVDLVVATTPSANRILFGGNVAYTINVTNNGPATATNVVLTDSLPTGATLVSATTTQGQVLPEGSTLLVPIGILAPGATATITLIVTPTSVGTAVNTATVASDQTDTTPANNLSVTSTDVFNLPGEFDFSADSYSALQSGGTVQITVVRNGGSLGAASVGFNVTALSARPGIDFVSTTRVLDFADGQLSQTVTLTLLDDLQHGPDRTILLTLSAPSNGVPLGARSAAVLTIGNAHPDLVGPVVTGTQLVGGANAIVGVSIGFSKPLDPTTANNINNYAITASNGSVVPIRAVSYNAITNVVTIVPVKALKTGVFYVLRVNGSTAAGLRDTTPAHNLLDGAGVGANGTDLIETFIRSASIRYADSNHNAVSLRLTGGGALDLIRFASGEAQSLTIVNPRAFRSVLSGSVRPGRFAGSGVTTIRSITGLAPFGTVRSTLTQPPFVVTNQPVFDTGAVSAAAFDRLVSKGVLRAARLAARRHH